MWVQLSWEILLLVTRASPASPRRAPGLEELMKITILALFWGVVSNVAANQGQ